MRCMIRILVLLVCTAQLAALSTQAMAATTRLSGTVVSEDKPVAGALVTVTGDNLRLTTRTDASGRFAFFDLSQGAYTVEASAPSGAATVRVDLATVGADVTLRLSAKKLGTITVTGSAPARQGGTDVNITPQVLAKSPSTGSFPQLLIQLPGAARGANGVVHINGDHGDINYIVDGVPIPQELNRNVGSEFNPNDVSYIDVLQGAYPAMYGGKFASVLDINTLTGTGPSGLSGAFYGGSYGLLDGALGYQNKLGAGSLVTAVRGVVSDRSLDPPNPQSPHNQGSDVNEFARYTTPIGANYLNFILSNSLQTFQIPNDVNNGEPASTDDNETQADLFSALELRHPIGTRGALTYVMGYKNSHIQDFGDPPNDWIYGEALNVEPPPYGNGGTPTDCATAYTPGVVNPNYGPTTCGYSLFSDRTAKDYLFKLDDALDDGVHTVRWGASYDITNVTKLYDIALQPGNFLAPLFAPATPGTPYAVVDNAPNDADTESAYLQDSWKMGSAYQLDYGLREDAFQVRSTEFDQGFSMLSPRIKLTRIFNPRASVYVFYGRYFTPFSFENVSPTAAYLLNLPIQPTLAQFDLKPQRDSVYELGGHLPLGAGNLGLRIVQRNATDLIDDTQVGVTALHQDINYDQGRIATQTAFFQQPILTNNSAFYVSFNHTYSVNKGCETQLLAPCFGSPTDWTPADHQQNWGATAGVLLNNRRGGWFSMDGEYGSGLSSGACPPTTPGVCAYTPHTIVNVEEGVALGGNTRLVGRVGNLLDDRFFVTYINAQGNHYSTPRTFSLGLEFGPKSFSGI